MTNPNIPGDPDFESGPAPEYAKTVAATIKASGYPPSWLIVQSFWPANLDVIEALCTDLFRCGLHRCVSPPGVRGGNRVGCSF